MSLALELESFHYPGGPELFLPTRLELSVGESLALVGPSGSGKSSLVTLLAGLHPQPLGGRLRGRVTCDETIGYLGSDPETFLTGFCSTVMEELGWSLFGQGWSPEEVQRRVEEVACELEISHLLWRDPRRLSGGQQQMVALACVWARRPRYLLLDEPASKLDPSARDRLRTAVESLTLKNKAGVLWATANLNEVTWCSHVCSLSAAGSSAKVVYESASSWAPGEEVVVPWPLHWSRRWGMGEIPWTSPAPPDLRELGSIPPSLEPVHVDIRGLAYRLPGAQVDLFAELDLQISRGECLGLIGVNGAGKTTLGRLIRGLSRARAGTVFVDGVDCGRVRVAQLASTVAYTFQDPANLFMRSRVDSELLLSGELLGLDKGEAERRADQALDLFALRPFAGIHPRELPATVAALLGVALSWVSGAGLQILDEPLARLDRTGRTILEGTLERWRQEKMTVVVIAHDLDWLCSICTTIAVLDDGLIVAKGSPTQVLTAPAVVARLGLPIALGGSLKKTDCFGSN